jgi:hypothetical protein
MRDRAFLIRNKLLLIRNKAFPAGPGLFWADLSLKKDGGEYNERERERERERARTVPSQAVLEGINNFSARTRLCSSVRSIGYS